MKLREIVENDRFRLLQFIQLLSKITIKQSSLEQWESTPSLLNVQDPIKPEDVEEVNLHLSSIY